MKFLKTIKIVIISSIISAIVGSGLTFFLLQYQKNDPKRLISEFYQIENAVHVSPHTIRKRMDKGETNYTLVDLRSPQEYEKEHVVTAINIPAYKDPNNSISLDKETEEKKRIINSFRQLPKDKEIIVYCYSMPCMTGRKIGLLLSENGIYVKHLGIGWNEWRYFWTLWNHDGETPTKMENYVISGKEPGKAEIKNAPSPCGEGELSC